MDTVETNVEEPEDDIPEVDEDAIPEEQNEEEIEDDILDSQTGEKGIKKALSSNKMDGHTKAVYCLKNLKTADGIKENRKFFLSGSGDKLIKVSHYLTN